MKIFEVVFWNSHGKPNSEDTIYLVRAPDFRSAFEDVQRNGSPTRNGTNSSIADVVYEVGVDLSPYADSNPCILRGPYFATATNFGWNSWARKIETTNEWIEEKIADRGRMK
jgi:hypothetical protein